GRDPHAFERPLPLEPVPDQPQHRHGGFRPFNLEFALVGQLDVSHVVIHGYLPYDDYGNGAEPGKLSEKRGRARSVPFFAPSRCLEELEPRFLPQDFGLVVFFPGKLWFVPAEMAIGGGFPEDRTAKLEVLDDAPRRHWEV